jgi:signal recognition particle receptor subunit beta
MGVGYLLLWNALILWSSKAIVHWLARGFSALSAFLIIGLLGWGLAAGVVAVFFPYIAILGLMTLASLLVFLPMRAAHWCWLQSYHINYKCPYDDCVHGRRMPVHVCDCGTEYDDLQPSFFGIFHHVCSHPDGKRSLPTMDFWGRNKLPRLCGGCRRPLVHSSLGQLREWPIFVMGGPNVGKTVFLAQAILRMTELVGAQRGAVVRLDSAQQESDHAEQLRKLGSGQLLAKTAETTTAYGLEVRIQHGLRALIYLFDKPGEYFERMRDFGKMQGIRGLQGIVLLVDPFSLPGLAADAEKMGGQVQASQSLFHNIASNLVRAIEQILPGNQSQQCDVPLAVVLSKADAFPVATHPFLSGLIGNGKDSTPDLNRLCREALVKLGAEDSIRLLEQKFSNLHYFACSALGRVPDLRNTSPFRPSGVEQPLLWLLGVAARLGVPQPARDETRQVHAMNRTVSTPVS